MSPCDRAIDAALYLERLTSIAMRMRARDVVPVVAVLLVVMVGRATGKVAVVSVGRQAR